jgi:hypothetical protein
MDNFNFNRPAGEKIIHSPRELCPMISSVFHRSFSETNEVQKTQKTN